MRRTLVLGLLWIGIASLFAGDSKYAKMEILIDGNRVPTYSHKKKTYVEAIKGREYSIRLSNLLEDRVGVALSVDGLNTIDAKQTKAEKASKWVLDPYQSIIISGWQVSDQQARQFFFASEDQSYAAKMGKTKNLGIISAAFFKERQPKVIQPLIYPPFYPYPYPFPRIDMGGTMGGFGGGGMMGGGGTGGFGGGGMGGGIGAPRGIGGIPPAAPGSPRYEVPQADTAKGSSKISKPEYAATGMGNRVDHEVENVNMSLEKKPFETINIRYEFRDALIKLKVPLDRPIEMEPLLRRQKAKGYDDKNFSPEP